MTDFSSVGISSELDLGRRIGDPDVGMREVDTLEQQ